MTREPFIVHCAKCEHEWAPCFLPAPVGDAMLRAMTRPCPACGHKRQFVGMVPRSTADGDAIGWLTNGDTGISSKTIWGVMMGRDVGYTSVPWDPDDFGRCYRLLKVMPSWRARLGDVAAKHPKWKPLVDVWDELTALYEQELPQGRAPLLYARMKELVG